MWVYIVEYAHYIQKKTAAVGDWFRKSVLTEVIRVVKLSSQAPKGLKPDCDRGRMGLDLIILYQLNLRYKICSMSLYA